MFDLQNAVTKGHVYSFLILNYIFQIKEFKNTINKFKNLKINNEQCCIICLAPTIIDKAICDLERGTYEKKERLLLLLLFLLLLILLLLLLLLLFPIF